MTVAEPSIFLFMEAYTVKRYEGVFAALTVFLVLMSLTLYQWHSVSRNAMSNATQRFEFRVNEIISSIEQRIRAYESALQGGVGLFAATAVITREDWEKYTQSLDLNENFPGIQGLGFAAAIDSAEKDALEAELRAEGFPEFSVWPEGDREMYTPIVLLEPFNWRNRRAFGYDMFSELSRRTAMTRAMETGQTSATEAVSLVQETGRDRQMGFLVYLPVYAGGIVPASVSERRQALMGFVYSPFRMHDLMRGILGPNALLDVHMEIYDGPDTDPARKIYGSVADPAGLITQELFATRVPFQFAGHQWTIRFSSLAPLEALSRAGNSNLVLLGGSLISFLLASFIWVLWLNLTRGRALAQANVDLLQEATQREFLELRLDRFFSMSTDILCTLNLDRTLRSCNPACQTILGFETKGIEGMRFVDIVHSEDRLRAGEALEALAERRVHRSTMEVRNLTADGGERWIEWHFVAAEEEPALYANGRDMTARKQMEQQLHQSAFYDRLTGVANRALFIDRLQHVIERSRRYGETYAVLILDLDNFKTVNDSYGHAIGDKLLAAFAERVHQQLRPVDTCARFGGDEFILLIEEAGSPEEMRSLARRIQDAMSLPFVFERHELYIGSSIGIAMGDRRYNTTQQVLRDADAALYEAKRKGRNRYLFFDEEMRKEQVTRKTVEQELSQALNRQELDVVYQPVMDIRTMTIVGCEALVRWEHPHLGSMQPADFIPVAETSGLINAIGQFVTHKACHDLARWQARASASKDFYVGVNLSPKEVFVGDLVGKTRKMLEESGLQAHNLRLEVTEGVLIERGKEAVSIFNKLRKMGVQICIDDFGTGYSSLSYLQSLPIDVLKLDRSLIERIQHSEKSHEIARTVLSLANVLKVKSIAEGVETEGQLQAIVDLGFVYAQGFWLHRPMSGEAMEALLSRDAGQQST